MINKVTILGYVTRDPEHINLTKGSLTNLIVSTRSKDKHGNLQKPDDHRIVAFGKMSEICKKFINRNQKVYVEGTLQYHSKIDMLGNRVTVPQIVAIYINTIDKRYEDNYNSDDNFGNSNEEV